MESITYYRSPVGPIKIKSDGSLITSILFVSRIGRGKVKQPRVVQKLCRELDRYFSKGVSTFSVPLAQSGTLLQQKVWNALLTIPKGSVVTYKDIAKKIKKPKAVRAVANAIGANNLTIVVPCHRVIGSNGTLTGYSAGIKKKAWLLHHELV